MNRTIGRFPQSTWLLLGQPAFRNTQDAGRPRTTTVSGPSATEERKLK